MDIEGLHGVADGRQTAQQLIDQILAADAKSRQLLNQQLHELDMLRHKGAPASLLKAEEERLAKITADLANRNQALLSLARANGWTVSHHQPAG
ncbi:MAG: hypothetical protein KatS3mg031_0196 [Chitinophagales bacterium]|nr:MAG: hypothetical protein KatS3mg031_0196 [Chitinophagales bacterium]